MGHTNRGKGARGSYAENVVLSADCSLQLDCMKVESLVSVYQNGTVNTFPGLGRAARHSTEAGST